MADSVETTLCTACGWIYDPEQGDPDSGIAPGTPWQDLPADWICPVCGAGKGDFEPIEPATASPGAGRGRAAEAGPLPLVIVGSGLAGYALAKELRKRSADLPIVVVTADGGEVYTKPMLSNAFARHHGPEDLVQKEAAVMAQGLGIEIRTRTHVLAIDRAARRLSIEDAGVSDALAYDRLVLAVGADARIFPAEGAETVEIFTVNDLDDYRRWRGRIGEGERILLIGAGLIGCEFANDLAAAGFDVALVDPAPWPLARLMPPEIGAMLVDALEGVGCRFHMGRTVARYQGTGPGPIAVLDDGASVPFDHVLSAVGLAPRTGLAKDAGLRVGVGILVDDLLRTNDPAIFALGDCAETRAGPLPYIAPLLAQARALAATLLGEETPLRLPAMPVVVKTPALALVLSPPRPGIDGAWELELDSGDAVGVFRTPEGVEMGFVLAGAKTAQHQLMAKRMPDLLPDSAASMQGAVAAGDAETGERYECDTCGYLYVQKDGDPDGGIAPGTRWEDIPDDWVCPTCGAGKADFTQVS